MSARKVSIVFGVVIMIYGGLLMTPVIGPLLAGIVGFLFLATGLLQTVLALASSGDVTCAHCQKKNAVTVGLWSAAPRLSRRD